MKFLLSRESFASLPGLSLIEKSHAAHFGADGIPVHFASGRGQPGFSLTVESDAIRVEYAAPCDAYRALGLLLADTPPQSRSQDRVHQTVGVMWDVSRNAVVTPDAWEGHFQKLALLGINSLQLYMEDVYAIPGEPFFGYARGAYSAEELRRIDACGHQFGIEVIPCIQTLGHLLQITQWPAYASYADVEGVLMVDEESTKALIGKMLDQMAACFRTRTIHIGMDEAHGLGRGQFLRKNGFQSAFAIINRHLRMVADLCQERGFQPMIWSDMYFRIGSKTNDYYDRASVIPQEAIDMVPKDVDLVYWDYYHSDPGFYEEWIRRHRALGKEPIFAAGAWSWSNFWAFEPRWRESLDAGMKVAGEQKLAHALLTVWGDDGAQCHPASTYPAVQHFTDWAYGNTMDTSARERQFAAIIPGASLSAYLKASELDAVPATRGLKDRFSNTSLWILWHDPILGFLNAHITPDLPEHYRTLAETLDTPDADDALRFTARVARAVGLKAELHLKVRAAWKEGNTAELRRLKDDVLPACVAALRELWNAHRTMWRQWFKPFGWEVLERRYAGCVARLESLDALLEDCLNNPALVVPEWESDPQVVHDSNSEVFFNYHHAATPSAIK